MARVQYKLLALDLDGTLLRPDGAVADVDREAVARVMARGVAVTIVTGRLYSGSRAAAEAIGVRGPIACINGSQVVDTRGHTELFHHRICGATAMRLCCVASRPDAAWFGLFADRVVRDSRGERYEPYMRLWSDDVERTGDVLAHAMWRDDGGLSGLGAVGDADGIALAARAIATEIPELHVVSFAMPQYGDMAGLLVRAVGTDKGVALDWLARHHGVAASEVVAVGDWLNDVPMLTWAGRSFAMNQAPDAVKAAASDVLRRDAVGGGGVAEVIARAFDV